MLLVVCVLKLFSFQGIQIEVPLVNMAQRMFKHIARECQIYSFKRRSALYIFNISDAALI
jgi:hypothetical protein